MKGETVDEVVGAARAMRARMTARRRSTAESMVDTCGTGGDGSRSVNVSTLAAFIVAGAGVVGRQARQPRAVVAGRARTTSSRRWALDPAPAPELAARCLREARLAFLFAPAYHAATRHAVGPAQGAGLAHDVQHAGAADQPVRRALSRERHLRRERCELLARAHAALGLAARAGRSRRGRPGRVRARGRDVRRRAARRRGAHATRSRPRTSAWPRATRPGCAGGEPADNARIALEVLGGRARGRRATPR